jgi:hypothetical protein
LFAAELRQLRAEAGSPSFRVMSKRAHYAPSTLAEATRGVRMPSRAVVEAFALAGDADPAEWALRWKRASTPPHSPYRRPELHTVGLSVASGVALAVLVVLGRRTLAGRR